jgi:2-keto-3-deoxy-L-rhamnonate aldolase RhmA
MGVSQEDPRHAEACQRVLDAANAAGLEAGIHCASAEQASRRFEQGFRLCPIGSDIGFVSAGARAALEVLGRTAARAGGGPYG